MDAETKDNVREIKRKLFYIHYHKMYNNVYGLVDCFSESKEKLIEYLKESDRWDDDESSIKTIMLLEPESNTYYFGQFTEVFHVDGFRQGTFVCHSTDIYTSLHEAKTEAIALYNHNKDIFSDAHPEYDCVIRSVVVYPIIYQDKTDIFSLDIESAMSIIYEEDEDRKDDQLWDSDLR
jgi:hypothetical protein